MKIRFRQSGGFAGLMRGCDLDTASMNNAEARILERLAWECTRSPGLSKDGADLVGYEIEFHDGEHRHRLEADDRTLTSELGQLVEQLQKYSTPQRAGGSP